MKLCLKTTLIRTKTDSKYKWKGLSHILWQSRSPDSHKSLLDIWLFMILRKQFWHLIGTQKKISAGLHIGWIPGYVVEPQSPCSDFFFPFLAARWRSHLYSVHLHRVTQFVRGSVGTGTKVSLIPRYTLQTTFETSNITTYILVSYSKARPASFRPYESLKVIDSQFWQWIDDNLGLVKPLKDSPEIASGQLLQTHFLRKNHYIYHGTSFL